MPLELQVKLAHREFKGYRVLQGLRVLQGPQEPRAKLAHKAFKDK